MCILPCAPMSLGGIPFDGFRLVGDDMSPN